MKLSRHLVISSVLLISAGDLCAQWNLVAPKAIIPITRPYGGGGILTHQDGILWAGYKDVWMSADTGRTWIMRTPFSGFNNSCIKDISFFDQNIGLATTQNGEIYITLNQGVSWVSYIPNGPYHFRPSIESARFVGSPKTIIACSFAGDIFVTADGGANWTTTLPDSITTQVISGSGGTAYVAGGFSTGILAGVRLHQTNDYGLTWSDRSAIIDWDSYSFARDECDTTIFYAASDDLEARNDGFSRAFVSHTEGNFWSPVDLQALPSHCGSVTTSTDAIFTQTYSGVRRSTDRGNTWKDIGGPPNIVDTRFVTALSNNIVIAVDSFGSVWVTTNSGGDSVRILSGPSISLRTADQKTDTVGGTVAVPLSIAGLNRTEDFDIVMHYDPQLLYGGTFSSPNIRVDIPGESWRGRSKLHFVGVGSQNDISQSFFDVFSDSSKKLIVSFDSLIMLSAVIPCTNTLTNLATSTITPAPGCEAAILSRYLRDTLLPQLKISPNPTAGALSLTSSLDLGEARIIVYDALGMQKMSQISQIRKNSPVKLLLDLAPGTYFLRVISDRNYYDLRFLLER
ncbi:MAG: T9SS type A sorting domain-containing protein [Ignavibacteriota bacterium]